MIIDYLISSNIEILIDILISSDREAFMVLLKFMFGTGCLAMPKGFSSVGWLCGIIMTIFFGLVLTHAMHVLVGYLLEAYYLRNPLV